MTDISKLSTIPSVTPEMQIPVWDNKNRQPRRASLQQVTDMATAGAAASAAEAAASAAETAAAVPSVNRDDYDDLRSYTGAATTAFVKASGIAGTFVRDATVTVDNGGTEIVGVHGWKRVFDGAANLMWFGVVGDDVADDTAGLLKAAALKVPVFVPPGKNFRYSTPLTLSSRWFGASEGYGAPGSASDQNSASFASSLHFVGTGWAITTQFEFSYLTLRGNVGTAGQNGIRFIGGVFQKAGPCRVMEFDGCGFELGNSESTPTSGIYFTDFSGIQVINWARLGAVGWRIHGGGTASSNGNILKGAFVAGAWTRYAELNGHNNLLLAGDLQPEPTRVASFGGTITEALLVNGDGNTWLNPYFEPTGGNPAVMIRFAAGSSGNRLERLYTPSSGGNFFSLVEDLGTDNDVSLVHISENFTQSIGRAYSERNLIPNPGFVSASSASTPFGWLVGGGSTGTLTVDATVTRGSKRTLKMSTAGTRHQLDCYASSTGTLASKNAISFTPIAALRGRTVSFGVWCLSSTAGMGSLAVLNGGVSLGTASHSGSGNWEFLTVRTRIDAAAADVAIRLRNSANFVNNTGECWFSEPVIVIGNDIPRFGGFKQLDVEDAAVMGRLSWNPPITFTDLAATPDVADGNFFLASNTGATTITNFLNGRSGQELKILTTTANTTLANNANITTTTGANKALASGAVYKLIHNGTKWIEFA
jgi:hypothetical protein